MKKNRKKNTITFKSLFDKAINLGVFDKSYSTYIRHYKKNLKEVKRLKRQIYKEEIVALNKLGIKNKTELKNMKVKDLAKKLPRNSQNNLIYESIEKYLQRNTPTKSYLEENYIYNKLNFNKRVLNNTYNTALEMRKKQQYYKPQSFNLLNMSKLDNNFVNNIIKSLKKAGHFKQALQVEQARKKFGDSWVVAGIKNYGGVVIDLFINNVDYRHEIENDGFYIYLNDVIDRERVQKTEKGKKSKNNKK